MNAELVSIGTEILLGEITDTNSTYIARQLRDIGVNVFYFTAVGDNLQRITNTIKQSLERSDIVITTGGLGPTVDDMTRQGVAAAAGVDLAFQQDLLDEITARFEKFGVTMTENNRQQAFVPAGAIVVHNPVGSAPSFIVETDKGTVISLPGVPREMKYLFENEVIPYLREKMGLPAIIKARVLHTAGIGESAVDSHITDLMSLENPTVGLAAHSGRTDVRITARADSEAQADAMIAEIEIQIRERLGKYIYGVDGEKFEEVMIGVLQAKGIQLSLYEAGTQGTVAERLHKLEGSANILGKTQSFLTIDDLRRELNLDAPVLKDLAAEAAAQLIGEGSDTSMVVLFQPDGLTALAVQTPDKTHSRELNLGTDLDALVWAIQWGLGYIWRYLTTEEA